MAQIIKNRRGSLERISAVSSSFQKGELIIRKILSVYQGTINCGRES